MEKLLSIVIPVFNGSKYIEQCAGFIGAQTFKDTEIIFAVDVKSTDGSVEIAEKAAASLDNARVVRQTNGDHLAGARNTGLDDAQGDYIWFCDVDDAPSPHFVTEMYGLASENDADMVCCGFINTGSDGVVKECRNAVWHTRVLGHDEAFAAISRDEFPVSTWSKLFRRQFLVDNNLRFENSSAEDIIHTFRVLDCSQKVVIYDRPLYAYRMTPGSLTRSKERRNIRAQAELQAYRDADAVCGDGPGTEEIHKHNARLRMRSSGHMDLKGFLEYQRSEEARSAHEKYFKGTAEGGLYRHFPRIYYYTEQVYFKLVYKRKGSRGMPKIKN
jgi:glycosyltransferase involved in cell wall biosynthesis